MDSSFDLFGLPLSVDIDAKWLESKYKELSLQWHPDRQPEGSDRVAAAARSASLNQAYQTLRRDSRRYVHILRLLGIDLDNQSATSTVKLGAAFLSKVLELREDVEKARAQKSLSAVTEMRATIQSMERASLDKAKQHLVLALSQPASTAKDQASQELAQLRFFERFNAELDAAEETLSP